MILSDDVLHAYELAKKVKQFAYAPYSKFHVGSALKLKETSQYFTGCNVENASFGGTVCAERNAIASMVAAQGKSPLEFIVVVTDTDPAIGPCGLCLQILSEFVEDDFLIYTANEKKIQGVCQFSDLLKKPFRSF